MIKIYVDRHAIAHNQKVKKFPRMQRPVFIVDDPTLPDLVYAKTVTIHGDSELVFDMENPAERANYTTVAWLETEGPVEWE